MATHSSIIAWEIQWTEEPGGLQSMGSQRVRHNLVTKQQLWLHSTEILIHVLHVASHTQPIPCSTLRCWFPSIQKDQKQNCKLQSSIVLSEAGLGVKWLRECIILLPTPQHPTTHTHTHTHTHTPSFNHGNAMGMVELDPRKAVNRLQKRPREATLHRGLWNPFLTLLFTNCGP